jgi:SAM-dependent methyltransferase
VDEAYDRIGAGYATARRPDPRLRAAITEALRGAARVVNVGAGAGSYEPPDRFVIAVEPSTKMLEQRARGAAPAVRARAEALPFRDGAFDAALGVLTIHHWRDWRAGVREAMRASRGAVALFTWDPGSEGFWLTQDYLPRVLEADRRRFPPIAALAAALGGARVAHVPIPHDCADGFLGAYWRRPSAYLDPGVRAGISSLATDDAREALARLASDLTDGGWARKHGAALSWRELDLGYRLVIGGERLPDARDAP